MLAERLVTHNEDAKNRLLSALRDRPIMTGIIGALADACQAFENAAYPLSAARMLFGNTAVGAQLDGIGRLVGLARNGVDDAEYQILILGVIAQNNSNGTIETLLRIAQIVFTAKSVSVITPESPGHSPDIGAASIGLEVQNAAVDPALHNLVISIVQKSIAANVALSWVSVSDGDKAFALDGPQAGLGFGDLNDSTSGGTFASLIYSNVAN